MEPKKKSKIVEIIILGIIIHIILLVSVFDTYFKSPLEKGISPVKSIDDAPSKRLIIYIADGLRAQAVMEEHETSAPFLTWIRKTKGSWGVSRTRVPTESRPNHVAILGGIYEDPSALFKGWHKFPVDFDTVLNESTNSWLVGTQEIGEIFKTKKGNNVRYILSPPELIDYKRANHTVLDQWVFDKFTNLLNESGHTATFQESGNIFSLHLGGLDMTGHSKKPNSRDYFENIRFVDENIKKMEQLIVETFPDNLTTFIFTSDHGMTDWGSHGSGSDHETFTPFIAWGAGIEGNPERQDIEQINIAPLISVLLGLNYPTNSIGKLPIHYLNLSGSQKLHVLLTNVKQVFKILETKQNHVKNKLLFFGRKYLTSEEFTRMIVEITHSELNYEMLFSRCQNLFDLVLKGIEYYNNYFMFMILSCVSSGLLLWMCFLSVSLVPDGSVGAPTEKDKKMLGLIFMLSSLFLIMFCVFQSLPIMYCLYVLFPNIMLFLVLEQRKKILLLFSSDISSYQCFELVFFALFIIILIASFHHRFYFAMLMLLVAFSIFWKQKSSRKVSDYVWIFLCLILSVFPLLPVMLTEFHAAYFIVGYISWQYFVFLIFLKRTYKFNGSFSTTNFQKVIFSIQHLCFNVGFLVVLISTDDHKDVEAFHLKVVSWVVFLLPIGLIPFSMPVRGVRMLTIFMAFAPFSIMTTMSYEMIFLTFYTMLLIVWMVLENDNEVVKNEPLENFRKSLIFVALILIGYFGTGNTASISSFDPMWVRCLVTSFSPFKIMSLIFLKHTLPFLYTACAFRNIVVGTRVNLSVCFCMILLISDVMVLYFMFNIKNVGSWAEIGYSFSCFVVVECFTIGILCFYFLAYFLTNVYITYNFVDRFFNNLY